MEKSEAQKAIDEMKAQREKYENNPNWIGKIKIFTIIIVLGIGFYSIAIYKKTVSHTKTEKKTAPSDWFNIDGEHIMFKDLAQAYLKFPHTYKHIQTLYSTDNEKEEMTVKTYFSGESSLRTLQEICLTAKYNFDGKLLTEPKECI